MRSEIELVDEQQIRRFLLGELSENQRVEVEERLFIDDVYYKHILAIQEELADDYVQNNLPLRQRHYFDQNFLNSPIRRERVEFAAALSGALGISNTHVSFAPRTPSWWQSITATLFQPGFRLVLATSAATLALFLGVVWLAVENHRLSQEAKNVNQQHDALLEQTRANQNAAISRELQLEGEIAKLRGQGSEMQTSIDEKQRELDSLRNARRSSRTDKPPAAVAMFILSPGLTRGTDEPEKLIISPAARSVQLQLDLEKEEDYQGYVAEIRTARGNLVWSRAGLKLQQTAYGQAVMLTVPADVLSTGEYEIALKGARPTNLEAIGYYYIIALQK